MNKQTQKSKNEDLSTTIIINENRSIYYLNLKSSGDMITFSLNYDSNIYEKEAYLWEIKNSESNSVFNSFSHKEFFELLRNYAKKDKIELVYRSGLEIQIRFYFGWPEARMILIGLTKKNKNIQIIDSQLKRFEEHFDKIEIENKELKKENKELREVTKELKKRIENLENEIEGIKKLLSLGFGNTTMRDIGSVIMKDNEFELIFFEIKKKFNKGVQKLIKLYQATIDGDGAKNFHSKCDNIPNTLVIIKSAGNRRFGGFTNAQWSSPSSSEYKDDPYAFLFSVDKQKIYPYKKDKKAILNNENCGPCFGYPCDLGIGKNCIKNKELYTCESSPCCSYNYNGDKNALSEDGKASYIYAVEYEVFSVIFN